VFLGDGLGGKSVADGDREDYEEDADQGHDHDEVNDHLAMPPAQGVTSETQDPLDISSEERQVEDEEKEDGDRQSGVSNGDYVPSVVVTEARSSQDIEWSIGEGGGGEAENPVIERLSGCHDYTGGERHSSDSSQGQERQEFPSESPQEQVLPSASAACTAVAAAAAGHDDDLPSLPAGAASIPLQTMDHDGDNKEQHLAMKHEKVIRHSPHQPHDPSSDVNPPSTIGVTEDPSQQKLPQNGPLGQSPISPAPSAYKENPYSATTNNSNYCGNECSHSPRKKHGGSQADDGSLALNPTSLISNDDTSGKEPGESVGGLILWCTQFTWV